MKSFQSNYHLTRNPHKLTIIIGSEEKFEAQGKGTRPLTVLYIEKIIIVKQGNL